MKLWMLALFSVAMNVQAYEQCSAKTEFCPEDGSYQGCRVVVDKLERFFSPHELAPHDCRMFCEYLANDYYPWPM